jgi:hypothetical protein
MIQFNVTAEARILWTTTNLTNGQIAALLTARAGELVRPQWVSNAVKALREANAPRGQQVNEVKESKVVNKVAVDKVQRDVVAVDEVDTNVFNVMCKYNNGRITTNHYVFVFQGKWACDCKAGQMGMNCKHVEAIFR